MCQALQKIFCLIPLVLSSQRLHEATTVITCIVELIQPRRREVKQLTQGLTARNHRAMIHVQVFPSSKPRLLNTLPIVPFLEGTRLDLNTDDNT